MHIHHKKIKKIHKIEVCGISSKLLCIYSRKRGAGNTVARDYVLPDYTHIKRGHVKSAAESSGKPKTDEQVCFELHF